LLKQDKHLQQSATTIADNKSLFFTDRRYRYVLCYRNVIVMLTRPSDMLPVSRGTQDQGNQRHALQKYTAFCACPRIELTSCPQVSSPKNSSTARSR
jgi:hypothetical protein